VTLTRTSRTSLIADCIVLATSGAVGSHSGGKSTRGLVSSSAGLRDHPASALGAGGRWPGPVAPAKVGSDFSRPGTWSSLGAGPFGPDFAPRRTPTERSEQQSTIGS
jgi:hypothetical protein